MIKTLECPKCGEVEKHAVHPPQSRVECSDCGFTWTYLFDPPGGTKYDEHKNRLDLLSIPSLMATARVLTAGAEKYGDRNWEKGIKYSRVFGALLRHLFKWWTGKEADEETGLPHIAHASCCLMFLLHYTLDNKYKEFDDRWGK